MRIFIRFLLIVIFCGQASLALAAAKLTVDQLAYDFGEVFQGEAVRHAFTFSNQGDAPLVVTKVRSSCGCTAALASSRELAPGEAGEIQANFDSTRFHGAVSKTIYLYTNDTTQPVAQLHLKGVVKELVTIKPKQINLGSVVAEEPVNAEFTILNQGDKALTLEPPSTTALELLAEIDATTLEAGQEAKVTLTYTPKPGQVRFSGYVTIAVSGSVQKALRVPVYAMIK